MLSFCSFHACAVDIMSLICADGNCFKHLSSPSVNLRRMAEYSNQSENLLQICWWFSDFFHHLPLFFTPSPKFSFFTTRLCPYVIAHGTISRSYIYQYCRRPGTFSFNQGHIRSCPWFVGHLHLLDIRAADQPER